MRAVNGCDRYATEVPLLFTTAHTAGLLKTVILTVLIVLAVIPLAVCMEVGDAGCAHACCTGADRSRPLHRALRRARLLVKSAASAALTSFADAIGFISAIASNLAQAPSTSQAVPLRI